MNNFRYIFLISTSFLFLIIGTDINAQSPGYQGHNVYISYDATPRFPKTITDESSFIDSTFVTNGDSSFTINLKHTVGLHYIFSRSLSFGVEYTFHQPRYFNTYYTADARFANFKVKAAQYGLNLKWFNFKKNGYIAPVGSFWELRPSLYQVTIEKDNYREQGFEEVVFEEVKDSYTGFAISAAFGMQTVWFGRLVPSYKMGVTIHPALSFFSFENKEETTQSELPKRAAMNSIGARDGFISDQNTGFTLDIRIGLGILLF